MTVSESENQTTESSAGSRMLGHADSELLTQAVLALRRRCRQRGNYRGLSTEACDQLGDTLTVLVTGSPSEVRVDRAEALSLAHRILDDDHPEASPMWPVGTAAGSSPVQR